MSKCRPPCCPGNSSESGAVAIIGLIMLAVAVYGLIRHILHVVIEIAEITAVTTASIGAVILLAVVAVRVTRWQHARYSYSARPQVIMLDPVNSLVPPQAIEPAKTGPDPAELFAEAIANDMDPRFIEKILDAAMQRPER